MYVCVRTSVFTVDKKKIQNVSKSRTCFVYDCFCLFREKKVNFEKMKLHQRSIPEWRSIRFQENTEGRFELWATKRKNRETIGFVEYTFLESNETLYLTRVLVRRDFRGCGIGSSMLNRFLRSQRRRGRRLFKLQAVPLDRLEEPSDDDHDRDTRERLLTWYERHGFKRDRPDSSYMTLVIERHGSRRRSG